jgi:subtilisin family serine protease
VSDFPRVTSVARPVVALLLLAVASMLTAAAPPEVPQRYIVVLRDTVSDPATVARDHARDHAADVAFVYSRALKGYAATIPPQRLAAVRSDPRVAYVEPDGTMSTVAQTLPWGIDRVDADLSSTLAGNGSGLVSNVNVYIIDTGIDASHPDLNVVGHVNFTKGKNADCNGHGTHVAGTVAARDNMSDVVGIAPGVPLTGVKVLGCNGSGSTSGVIAGIDWVTANAAKPAVANLSLGGRVSLALDSAVRNSAATGVLYTIAAGNSGADACNASPARAGTTAGVITVAATDSAEREASWSNYGTCVDIWAPGVSILSTRRGGGTTTMSGTSMAAPHAGGAAALFLSMHTTSSPATTEGQLKGSATTTGTASKNGQSVTRLYVGAF